MNEQPFSLPASLREIWRRRLLVIGVAVICGVAGLTFGFLKPQDSTAVALVLLPPSAASTSGTPANDTHTDAVIANSTPVLAAAGAKVSPPVGVTKLKSLVTVTALSGQILQVQSRASQAAYALQLANAVAQSYVTYAGQLATTSVGPQVTALQQQSAVLTKQINALQTQIDTVTARIATEPAGSGPALQDSSLLSSLQNEQNQSSTQLSSITSQISAAQVASGSAASTTRILQQATAVPVNNSLPFTAGLIGFVIGLFGSAAFVLVRIQRDHRLRFRDEIAQAAGVPVIASIEAPACTSPTAWRELLDSQPRATAEWALRNILRTVQGGAYPRSVVRVISFAGDPPALTTGPRLALHGAASGMTTVLDPEELQGQDRSLVALRAAFTGADSIGRDLPFSVSSDDSDDDDVQLLVSLVVFGSESAMVGSSNAINLLSLSPNTVTADQLAQLALEAADAGSPLDCVVVVNPDPADTTTGNLANDTLHLLPSTADIDLNALATNATSTPERLSSQER